MDFTKSFKEGLISAENIEKEKSEINNIFDELNKQIHQASNEKINIIIDEQYESANKYPTIQSISRFIEEAIQKKTKLYIAAEACSFESERKVRIAEWKPSANGGYPCIIRYEEHEVCVYDKGSLILELNNLIGSAYCGQIFNKLLN
ncbi:hypothetical protein [Gilliamella apicola]|uniref:hypothetical protein n=1 Tax=Gilliamella apicola TaxID=1196095 RepID=UPI002FEE2B0D